MLITIQAKPFQIKCSMTIWTRQDVRFETFLQKLHQLWSLVNSRLCFEGSVMDVAHVLEKLGNSALMY